MFPAVFQEYGFNHIKTPTLSKTYTLHLYKHNLFGKIALFVNKY